MSGAGFTRDMLDSSRKNRSLLRGSDEKYKNFDKAYITDYTHVRKAPVFKDATPEYLATLKVQLLQERKQQRRRMLKVIAVSAVLGVVSFFAIGYVYMEFFFEK